MVHEHVLGAIGGTPLVEIRRLWTHPRVKILAKLEARNPGGSIKDRVALAMVEAAEREGLIGPDMPDKIIIEATSGNTGIGLAMVCAVKGYRLRLLMPSTASAERTMIMQAYGAEIQLTPGHLSTDGAIEEAYRLAREHPETYVLMDQFNNPASIAAHYEGTGLEIWNQTQGRVTHVIATLGTSGTAMGVTKRMREMNPAIQVVALEPRPGHALQGLKNMQASYPPGIYDKRAPDRVVRVEDEESFEMCRRLAREEGVLAGMSSGAAMVGAIKVARELDEGLVVAIFPDGGERYLSTPLFAVRRQTGLRLRDWRTREDVYLETAPQPLGLYSMAPPLDDLDDLEAWRRLALLDLLARMLEARGVKATAVAGVADLDDRALAAGRDQKRSREEFTRRGLEELARRAGQLGLTRLTFHPASAAVPTLLAVTEKLLSKGAAYEKMRSVYFDVLRFPEYGLMSRTDLDKLSLGKTVDLAEYAKENPKDFTLLKRVSLRDLKHGDVLATQWGNVRPSWFLQMAAVAQTALPSLAVFLADRSHSFPHLENFRAIWRLGANMEPRVWQAVAPVATPSGETAPALFAGTPDAPPAEPLAFRLWLLAASPDKPLQASQHSLAMWTKNWRRLQQTAGALAELAGDVPPAAAPSREAAALLDDLAAVHPKALDDNLALHRLWPGLLRVCRHALSLLAQARLAPADAAALWQALASLDDLLGFLDRSLFPLPRHAWPPEAARLVADREAARARRDFDTADQLRQALAQAGYRVEDAPHGPRLHAHSTGDRRR